jgi:ubiquinol-cytochrome c reductase cytochrome c subunit
MKTHTMTIDGLRRAQALACALQTSQVWRRSVLATAVAAFALAGVAAVAQAPTPPQSAIAPSATGDAKRGEQTYTKAGCYQCHGRQAQGGAGGLRLAPRPLPLAGFSRYVRRPTGQMPPFTAKVLSDPQLADIYAFLRTIPEPPAVSAIPLLNQ